MDIIDQTQMSECMTGEADLDRDLIQSAIEEIDSRIADMQASLDAGDSDAWKKHAHRSVGAAATLGFKALAEQFRHAEHNTTNDDDRSSALVGIKDYMQQTRQELARLGMI